MRKVLFKYYKKDTQEMSVPQKGFSHTWGMKALEPNDGPSVMYSIGIIETEDGAIMECEPENIRFTKTLNYNS